MADVPAASSVELRTATDHDVDFLARVVLLANEDRYAAHEGWDRDAFYSGLIEDARDQVSGGLPNSTTYVIVSAGHRVGRLRLVTTTDQVEIAGLQILPENQGCGIGTSVVRSILARASDDDVPVLLDVETDNPGAKRLYERLGFSIAGAVVDGREPMVRPGSR